MEPSEIWELILKADDALKYARARGEGPARERAEALLRRALEAAEASRQAALASQARLRLDDLEGRG